MPAQQPGRLFAESIRYEGSVIIAEGGADGVRFEGTFGQIRAERLRIDTAARTLRAEGKVRLQRTREVARKQMMPNSIPERRRNESVTETLRGENLVYDFNARTGSLDNAVVELANFSISSSSIIINGQRYIAHNVVLRPGGLTEAEIKIYGTPPFSLKAKTVTIDTGAPGSSAPARAAATGAGLYFKNTRILPVPSYVLRSVSGSGNRDKEAFTLTPRLTFNSTDRILLTTKLRVPFSKANPTGAAVDADVGLSARIGLRGGLAATLPTRGGTFMLSGRVNDIVTTQLTNRIVLDRQPEFTYTSPLVSLFSLPGGRKAGILVGAGIGRFGERTIGGGGGEVHDTRSEAQVVLTTRATDVDGPYLDLFGRVADYSKFKRSYSSTGFEVGYYGNITNRIRGLFSYRSSSISGATPFRFDQIEIARELRTTFDIKLSPRYVIPIDLRYDLDLDKFRDESFGILRNYKNFAYGITYETARRELSFEVRSGF